MASNHTSPSISIPVTGEWVAAEESIKERLKGIGESSLAFHLSASIRFDRDTSAYEARVFPKAERSIPEGHSAFEIFQDSGFGVGGSPDAAIAKALSTF